MDTCCCCTSVATVEPPAVASCLVPNGCLSQRLLMDLQQKRGAMAIQDCMQGCIRAIVSKHMATDTLSRRPVPFWKAVINLCRCCQAGRAVHSVCCHAVPATVSAAGPPSAGSAHPAHVRDSQGAHSSLLQRCTQRSLPERTQAGSLPCCVHLANLQSIQHTAGLCVHCCLSCVFHSATGAGLDGGYPSSIAAACAGNACRILVAYTVSVA